MLMIDTILDNDLKKNWFNVLGRGSELVNLSRFGPFKRSSLKCEPMIHKKRLNDRNQNSTF